MDNRLSTILRVLVCLAGFSLVLVAVVFRDAVGLAIVALPLGVLLFAWGVNGTILEAVSLAKAEAKFRQLTIDALKEEVAEPVVVRPDPAVLKLEVLEPEVRLEPAPEPAVPTHHLRTLEDTVVVSEDVEAKVTSSAELQAETAARWERLRAEAAAAHTPKEFARLILKAIEDEKGRQPSGLHGHQQLHHLPRYYEAALGTGRVDSSRLDQYRHLNPPAGEQRALPRARQATQVE